MTSEVPKPLKVFCSYSRRDERYLNDLRDSLRGLEREGLIEWWHDREIAPGWEWEEDIDKHLRTADVILLLVSRPFMASNYVYEKEIRVAVERHERGEARVIPIIIRPTDWQWASFGKLQALPEDAKPINEWSNRDRAWLNVVIGVRKTVNKLRVERQEQAAKDQYRKAVKKTWIDKKVTDVEAEQLSALASKLHLSADTAAVIERGVMGDTKEAILDRQEQIAREKERMERLDELYAQARRLHRAHQWQAVVDVFEQVRAEDTDYPDPEGLLESAREALKSMQRVAALYDRGLQHMNVEEWQRALECFEEVQRLEPGYRDTEKLVSQVNRRYAKWHGEIKKRAQNWLESDPVDPMRRDEDKLLTTGELAEAEEWLLKRRGTDLSQLEREFIGASREREQQKAARREYREALTDAWKRKRLSKAKMASLRDLLESKLKLSPSTAADVEYEVMGDTKEAVIERQEQLDKLYAKARRLHRNQEWQKVINVFEQIHKVDQTYLDKGGLLESAQQALTLRRRVEETYDHGLQHMNVEEWQRALECFEEVQRLEPGYRDTEKLVSQVSLKTEERIVASSGAKRKAEELGIDLSRIEGSGAGGRVMFRDVMKLVERTGGEAANQSGRAAKQNPNLSVKHRLLKATLPGSIMVSCIYSVEDEKYFDQLQMSLNRDALLGSVTQSLPFAPSSPFPGVAYEGNLRRVATNPSLARITVLLVTSHFINLLSVRFGMDIDIKQAMAKQEGGTGRVIPIIVHPVPWQLAPFGRLQALPKDAKPISTWPKEYEAWFDVVKGIKETAEELSRSTTLPSRTRNKEADESTGLSHRLSLRDLSLRDKFLMGFFEEPRGPQQEE